MEGHADAVFAGSGREWTVEPKRMDFNQADTELA
jgi:hypothetical protein